MHPREGISFSLFFLTLFILPMQSINNPLDEFSSLKIHADSIRKKRLKEHTRCLYEEGNAIECMKPFLFVHQIPTIHFFYIKVAFTKYNLFISTAKSSIAFK